LTGDPINSEQIARHAWITPLIQHTGTGSAKARSVTNPPRSPMKCMKLRAVVSALDNGQVSCMTGNNRRQREISECIV